MPKVGLGQGPVGFVVVWGHGRPGPGLCERSQRSSRSVGWGGGLGNQTRMPRVGGASPSGPQAPAWRALERGGAGRAGHVPSSSGGELPFLQLTDLPGREARVGTWAPHAFPALLTRLPPQPGCQPVRTAGRGSLLGPCGLRRLLRAPPLRGLQMRCRTRVRAAAQGPPRTPRSLCVLLLFQSTAQRCPWPPAPRPRTPQ